MDKIQTSLRLIFALSALFSSPSLPAQTDASIPDSILTQKFITGLAYTDPKYGLALLDEAESRQLSSLPLFAIDFLRATMYESLQMYSLKEKFICRALESDSVKVSPKRKLKMLNLYIGALYGLEKYEESVRVASEMVNLSRETGNKQSEADALAKIGEIYLRIQLPDKGFQYIQQAVDLLQETQDIRELATLSYIYGLQMASYNDFGDTDRAIEIGENRIQVITYMSTFHTPPGYIDQQYGYGYSKLAHLYYKAGNLQKAANAYKNFLDTKFSGTTEGASAITPYLLAIRQYQRIIEFNRINEKHFEKIDTIHTEYKSILEIYAQAYNGLGNYQLAAHYMQRAKALTDSIYAREKQSRTQELATIFDMHEKERLLTKSRNALRQQRIISVSVGTMAILILCLLWGKYRHLRSSRHKNRILVRQIDELIAQREKIRLLNQTISTSPISKDVIAVNIVEQPDAQTQQLFDRLEKAIAENRLYLNPKLSREDLVRLMGINKNRITQLIRECTGLSFYGYINKQRIEYAIYLIKSKTNFSIEAIAEEAGFNCKSSFYAAFRDELGMTPKQYRDNL